MVTIIGIPFVLIYWGGGHRQRHSRFHRRGQRRIFPLSHDLPISDLTLQGRPDPLQVRLHPSFESPNVTGPHEPVFIFNCPPPVPGDTLSHTHVPASGSTSSSKATPVAKSWIGCPSRSPRRGGGAAGPHGAGKTTSFRMTIGMITPEAGQVVFADRDVTTLPMYKHALAGMGT